MFFLIVRNVVNNSPAISFDARALVRDVKDKKPSKNHDFRAGTPDPGLRGERDKPRVFSTIFPDP